MTQRSDANRKIDPFESRPFLSPPEAPSQVPYQHCENASPPTLQLTNMAGAFLEAGLDGMLTSGTVNYMDVYKLEKEPGAAWADEPLRSSFLSQATS